MLYKLSGHDYEFTNKLLKIDGKSCRSKFALYSTIMAELHRFGYKPDWPNRPLPPCLINYRDIQYNFLYHFAANLFSILSVSGQKDKDILQACRISPSGTFITEKKERVFAYQVYDRFNHLVDTGSSFDLDFLKTLVHDGQFILVR